MAPSPRNPTYPKAAPAADHTMVSAPEKKLAAKPLASLVATKRLMKQGQQAATLQRIEEEGHTFGQLLRGPAAKEALSAFMQKRRPDFSGC